MEYIVVVIKIGYTVVVVVFEFKMIDIFLINWYYGNYKEVDFPKPLPMHSSYTFIYCMLIQLVVLSR